MSSSNKSKSSIYYTTTAEKIQAALKFTLTMTSSAAVNYMVKIEVYNGDPAHTVPVYTKTQQIGSDDIFNFGTPPTAGGEVMAFGAFTKRDGGLLFEGGLESAYSKTKINGLIGVYDGDGPVMSKPFEFAKNINYPSETCNVNLGLAWDNSRSDYNVNWSFEGESGTVELTDGKGTLSYAENGVTISGTFDEDLMYRFSGVFIKPGKLQFGFTNAGYAGWLGKSQQIR